MYVIIKLLVLLQLNIMLLLKCKKKEVFWVSSPLMANQINIQRRGNEDSKHYIKLHNTVLGKFFFHVLNKLLSLPTSPEFEDINCQLSCPDAKEGIP